MSTIKLPIANTAEYRENGRNEGAEVERAIAYFEKRPRLKARVLAEIDRMMTPEFIRECIAAHEGNSDTEAQWMVARLREELKAKSN